MCSWFEYPLVKCSGLIIKEQATALLNNRWFEYPLVKCSGLIIKEQATSLLNNRSIVTVQLHSKKKKSKNNNNKLKVRY